MLLVFLDWPLLFDHKVPDLCDGPDRFRQPVKHGGLGDENGNVYVWRSVEAVKDNIGVNLTGHTAHI